MFQALLLNLSTKMEKLKELLEKYKAKLKELEEERDQFCDGLLEDYDYDIKEQAIVNLMESIADIENIFKD